MKLDYKSGIFNREQCSYIKEFAKEDSSHRSCHHLDSNLGTLKREAGYFRVVQVFTHIESVQNQETEFKRDKPLER